jgi:hypothetical protein
VRGKALSSFWARRFFRKPATAGEQGVAPGDEGTRGQRSERGVPRSGPKEGADIMPAGRLCTKDPFGPLRGTLGGTSLYPRVPSSPGATCYYPLRGFLAVARSHIPLFFPGFLCQPGPHAFTRFAGSLRLRGVETRRQRLLRTIMSAPQDRAPFTSTL